MRPQVHGSVVDAETRCVHYRTELDVIAIKFSCCGDFYPCHFCHRDAVDHPAVQWPAEESHERAVLCGVCSALLTIAEYADAYTCPSCAAPFNPGCKLHWEYYFCAPIDTARDAGA
ncbi:CHY zinc finger protein [Agromyces endophyticus]|nr:CHY zinc finger protein [Agromyces sp. H17E-10]UOQ91169.1 CHY zinc finger protein [Agromyces sp. H17E-10]